MFKYSPSFFRDQAYKELGLLIILVGVAVLTFSSLVFYAEKDSPVMKWTFLDSFWWGLMTLTTGAIIISSFASYFVVYVVVHISKVKTKEFSQRLLFSSVGYGTQTPASLTGKAIGGVCAVVGVFILTLPVPIVVNSFASYYKVGVTLVSAPNCADMTIVTKCVEPVGIFSFSESLVEERSGAQAEAQGPRTDEKSEGDSLVGYLRKIRAVPGSSTSLSYSVPGTRVWTRTASPTSILSAAEA